MIHATIILQLYVLLVLSTTYSFGTKIMFETIKNGGPVVCNDSLANRCTASTDCGVLGSSKFDTGDNFQFGAVTSDNGLYVFPGGYSITFPIACNVTCVGNCTCDTCSRQIQLNDDDDIPSASAGSGSGSGSDTTKTSSNATSSSSSYIFSSSVIAATATITAFGTTWFSTLFFYDM